MTSRIPSRRRLVRATLLAALVFVVGDVALGLALAGDPAATPFTPPPPTFGTPAPAVGDIVTYAYVRGELAPEPYHQLQWTGQGTFLDGDGSPTRFHTAGVADHRGLDIFDAATGRFIGERFLVNDTSEDPYQTLVLSGTSTREYTHNSTLFYGDHFRGSELPCGVRHTMQGTTRDTAGNLPLLAHCTLPSLDSLRGSGPYLFRADRTERLGDLETVVFVLDAAPPPSQHNPLNDVTYRVTVWLSAQFPYAVRVETQETRHMGDRDVTEPAEAIVLTGFTRGDTPLDLSPASGEPAPPLEFRAAKPWGIDDSDLQHPFPLSTAYEQARTSPEYADLRDFLATHPDAFTASAAYAAFHRADHVTHRWTVTVADKTAHVEFCAYRYELKATLPSPGPSPLPAPPTIFGPAAESCEWIGAPMDPALKAEYLPTAKSLLARAQAYLDANQVALTANAYNLFACTPGCAAPQAIQAGAVRHDYTDRAEGDLPFVETEQVWRTGELSITPDGVTHGFSHSVQHDADDMTPEGGVPASEPTDSAPLAFDVAEVALWTMPSGEMLAGMGLVAAGAGALYAVWPSAKGMLAPLFSRVERPRALEHPQRRRLEAVLSAEPGLTTAEIARRIGASRSTVAHHLAQLRGVGLVTSERTGRRTNHFLKGTVDRRLMEAAPLVAPDGARSLLAVVAERPDLSVSELAARTGLAASTVHHHLDRLEKAQLVERRRVGRAVLHRLTGLGEASLTRFTTGT